MYMCRKINRALNGKKRASMSLSGTLGQELPNIGVDGEIEEEGIDGKKRSRNALDSFDTSSSSSSGASGGGTYVVGSGGILRGMDDDEIEGEDGDEKDRMEGQDEDLFFGEGSDTEDYESEDDNSEGDYDSLGEEEILSEDKERRLQAAALAATNAALKGSGEDGGGGVADVEKVRNRMLREVLGLPEG